jgi:hypothetical protein
MTLSFDCTQQWTANEKIYTDMTDEKDDHNGILIDMNGI